MITARKKYGCPCCGYLTLGAMPPGTDLICPVCFWEDDMDQSKDPDFEGGINRVSLRRARHNFAQFKASERAWIHDCRDPLPEEVPFEAGLGLRLDSS